MTTDKLISELRHMGMRLRTSSMPLNVVVPLMQEAADRIYDLRASRARLAFLLGNASAKLRESNEATDLLMEIIRELNKITEEDDV